MVCLRAMGYIQSNMSNGEMVEATKKEKIIQRMNYHDLVPYVKKTKMGILELDINFLFDGNKNLIDKNVYEMGTMVYKGRYRITGLNPYTNLAFLCCHFYREATDTIWTEGKRDVTLYKIVDMMNFIRFYREQINYDTEDFEDLEKMSNASFVDKNLDEVIQIPSFSLSPSACFHVYEKYRGQTMPQNSVITLNQSVFRNEGRLNWEEFGRLRDYHVREIVFLGTQEFVEQTRENIREEVMTFIRKMNMDAYITVAADAFIMPKMIKYKKYQKMEKSKYEVRVSYDKDHTLAAASLNLHGTAFTSPFHIKVKGVDNPVSGCVGFGIERWILVFLAQYGTDSACWPDEVKKFIRQKG